MMLLEKNVVKIN